MANPYPYEAIKLNTGAFMPLFGLGTWQSAAGEVGLAVKQALHIGYRHIDCAAAYDNENEIGKAIAEVISEGKIKREEIFLTSKVAARVVGVTGPSGIADQLAKTLSELKTSYLDLYLIHQPVACKSVDGKIVPVRGVGWGVQDMWREMEKAYLSGQVKAIGVSNFPTAILNDLLAYAKVPPAVQQIELTPYLVQKKHVAFCRQNGLVVTAYGSLGSVTVKRRLKPDAPELLKNETVNSLAKKYGKTPAQILIRWALDNQIVSIPKSVKEERLKENYSIWDFKLSPEDVNALSDLDSNLRVYEQEWHTVPTFT